MSTRSAGVPALQHERRTVHHTYKLPSSSSPRSKSMEMYSGLRNIQPTNGGTTTHCSFQNKPTNSKPETDFLQRRPGRQTRCHPTRSKYQRMTPRLMKQIVILYEKDIFLRFFLGLGFPLPFCVAGVAFRPFTAFFGFVARLPGVFG